MRPTGDGGSRRLHRARCARRSPRRRLRAVALRWHTCQVLERRAWLVELDAVFEPSRTRAAGSPGRFVSASSRAVRASAVRPVMVNALTRPSHASRSDAVTSVALRKIDSASRGRLADRSTFPRSDQRARVGRLARKKRPELLFDFMGRPRRNLRGEPIDIGGSCRQSHRRGDRRGLHVRRTPRS